MKNANTYIAAFSGGSHTEAALKANDFLDTMKKQGENIIVTHSTHTVTPMMLHPKSAQVIKNEHHYITLLTRDPL